MLATRNTVIASVLLLLAFYPVWQWLGLRFDDGGGEPWGLLPLLLAGSFLIRPGVDLRLRWSGLAIGLVAFYVMGFTFFPPLIRATIALGILCSVVRLDRVAPGLCGLLVLSLPVIATVQFYLGYPLRLITAESVAGLLQICPLDGEITRHGTVLWWDSTPIGVDPPCSGVQMLWSGLLLHFALATFHRLSWRSILWMTPLAVAAVIVANVVRGFLLFFKETQVIDLPDWTHAGIGVVVFSGLVFLWCRLSARTEKISLKPASEPTSPLPVTLLVCGLIAAAPLTVLYEAPRSHIATTTPFPEEFEGEPLTAIPLSIQEERFAENFPGTLALFETPSGKRLILRHVEQPTRKLHSTADCLRAVGYALDSSFSKTTPDWSHWEAVHPIYGKWHVREQITNHDNTWNDISAWYWTAFFQRSTGPWLATTVMER